MRKPASTAGFLFQSELAQAGGLTWPRQDRTYQCHEACRSALLLLVIFCMPVPSAFTIQRSKLPLRVESKTIMVLSGDQAGFVSNPEPTVSWLKPVPSGLMDQM